jgi:hypothetical protein
MRPPSPAVRISLCPARPAVHGRTLTPAVGEPGSVRRRRYLAGIAVATAAPVAGCSGDGDGAATVTNRGDVYRGAFIDAVESDGHDVTTLTVDTRVDLEYTPAEASEPGVRQSINDVARAFFDRVYGGWDVEGLDAGVQVNGSLVATWNMERAWIEAYVDGDISREELGRRVEDSVERRDRPSPSESRMSPVGRRATTLRLE